MMVLAGETLATGANPTCPDCHVAVVLAVYSSPAGFYVGGWCNCGPYTRESGYYRTRDEAQVALETGDFYR